MTTAVIEAHGISKRYERGARSSSSGLLRDTLARAVRAPWTVFQRQKPDTFWALNDVSLQVGEGEVLGLIGRNGSGKTTLLKVLSRITRPTSGWAEIHGRVGSLLEVGTGFHPELTGRENAYLSGAILGMSRQEITRKFDEIVAFAELDKFIDTPVKHYSSGMFVRLAFAVAAHLEPEILVVDEVLAVGDVQFQQKCLGKMGDVASRQGRTVLFVSHNMGAIQALCRRGICLSAGSIFADTDAAAAVSIYLKSLERTISKDLLSVRERKGKGEIRLAKVEILSDSGEPTETLTTGKPTRFVFHVSDIRSKTVINFLLYDMKGNHILILNSDNRSPQDSVSTTLRKALICDIEKLPLLPGRYRMQVNVGCCGEHQDSLDPAAIFDVVEGYFDGRRELETPFGVVTTSHRWTIPESRVLS
jgi:lipopolysaccharide transport system ATP-binding protein